MSPGFAAYIPSAPWMVSLSAPAFGGDQTKSVQSWIGEDMQEHCESIDLGHLTQKLQYYGMIGKFFLD